MAGLQLGSVLMSLDHAAIRAHMEAWGMGHNLLVSKDYATTVARLIWVARAVN